MNIILAPFIHLMEKMNFGKRFLLISMIIFGTLLTISSMYIMNKLKDRQFLTQEIGPAKYYVPVVNLMKKLDLSRSLHLHASVDAGADSIRSKLNEADNDVDAALSNLKQFTSQGWTNENVNQQVQHLDSAWVKLKSTYDHEYNDETYSASQELLNLVNNLLHLISNESNLDLDADVVTANLVQVFTKYAPQLANRTESIADISYLAFKQKQLSQQNRERIISNLALIDYENTKLNASLQNVLEAESSFIKFFGSHTEMISKNSVSNLIWRDLLQTTNFDIEKSRFLDEISKYQSSYYAIADMAYKAYWEELHNRINVITYNITLTIISLSTVFVIICLIFAAFYSSTDNAVQKLINSANTIAKGDLTENVDTTRSDEFGLIMKTLDNLQKRFRDIVQQIKNTSNAVGRGTEEISQGNLDLSKRTEDQASSLASTAASMEELSITVKENAEQSKKAAELAENARKQADNSGLVVNNAVSAMTQINASSKKIAEISSVIDEIAFQTNLLALNAAIEAARAGEQGRGFAVVAQEVRNLAQRSSTAAKEINTLISDSVDKINSGTELVNQSGTALQEIVKSSLAVSELVASIATATTQQSKGLDEINKAITQLDGITQQNAALVEETAATSENVNHQVRDLIIQIEFFKNISSEQIILPTTTPPMSKSETPTQHIVHKKKPKEKGAHSPIITSMPKRKGTEQDWAEF